MIHKRGGLLDGGGCVFVVGEGGESPWKLVEDGRHEM